MGCKQISELEILNLMDTWVSLFNVSLKMHADVIAGRQKIFRLEIKDLFIFYFVNECVNPPGICSLATSFKEGMGSEEEIEVGRTYFFVEPDEIVEEGELELDEGVV